MLRHLAAISCLLLAPATLRAEEAPLTYETHVRPILKAQCFQCHGEEDEHKGSLDLRLVRGMTKGGDSGAVIVAGNSAESLLVERIAAGEMPPGEKKLSAGELNVIRRWIDQGAKTAKPEPEQIGEITDEERSFWSFRAVQRPAIPTVRDAASVRTPVDAFLLAELEKRELGFSPEADRPTLLRRLTFDLTGLPPTPEDVEQFVADDSPDAYDRLVDRLLESPQYGERWGRHWLDVAGYADSDGYTEKDFEREWAWKYRDYVVRAFNADKPWNEFLVEQLAGDELLTPPYANLSPEDADKLIATGFLRMGPDGTADGSVDQNLARNEVMAETIKIVSTSLLGLSVGCAQCHTHRYDPITHVDYHRFRAIFEPAYDWKHWRVPKLRLVSLWTDADRQKAAEVDAEAKALSEERLQALDKIVEEIFASEVEKLPEEQREMARVARGTVEKDRTPEQKELLKAHPSLNVNRGSAYLYDRGGVNKFNKDYDAKAEAVKAKRPPENFVHCLTEEPGRIPATKLFFRGDVNQPREDVLPGELEVLGGSVIPVDDPNLPTSGRRLAYAHWLTSGQHPLVARVLVNRFWLHHFGKGIVATPGDFGVLGTLPTHPELLDWLASEFMAGGWKLKPFHKLLVLSRAYRQSSQRTDALDAVDPDNQWLARMNVRRLEAEALRDSILSVSGTLTRKLYGPPVPVMPDDVGQVVLGIDTRDSAGRPSGKVVGLGDEVFRRSLYVQARRSLRLGMLETFDAPDMRPNCEIRNSSTVSPQSLLLMNNEFVLEQSETFARRVIADAGDSSAAQVRRVWTLAFGREPTDAQRQAGETFLTAQTADFAAVADPKLPPAEARALASYCQAVLSANRFLYVD